MEHTPKGETVCPGCGTTWVSANPSVGFESSAEGSFPSRNAAACPLHAAAPELLKALEKTAFEAHQGPGHNGGLKRCLHGTCRQARAAIKAAKGDA